MSSRSDDPVAEALRDGVGRLRDAVRAVAASNPVVVIDGRSGAGKTSLARLLAANWPLTTDVQSIALDSLYPGWDGLEEGAAYAYERVLRPHGRGVVGTWQRYDWTSEAYAESHAVDPARGVIVEGCGVLTPRSARVADVRVWVESPETSRKARALARDGEAFRPHWERWARQEEEHLRRDRPQELATILVQVP